MPFPTHTYKCVGAQDHESLVWSHVVGWPALLPCARRSWIFPLPSTPPCATAPHCPSLRCKGPYGSVNSKYGPVVHRRALRGSERLEVVLEIIQPVLFWASLAWVFPPDQCFVHQPLREAPGGLSGHGSREQKSPLLLDGSFHALAPSPLEDLSVRTLSVGAALAAVPDNSQE